jgi:hypothetical protein
MHSVGRSLERSRWGRPCEAATGAALACCRTMLDEGQDAKVSLAACVRPIADASRSGGRAGPRNGAWLVSWRRLRLPPPSPPTRTAAAATTTTRAGARESRQRTRNVLGAMAAAAAAARIVVAIVVIKPGDCLADRRCGPFGREMNIMQNVSPQASRRAGRWPRCKVAGRQFRRASARGRDLNRADERGRERFDRPRDDQRPGLLRSCGGVWKLAGGRQTGGSQLGAAPQQQRSGRTSSGPAAQKMQASNYI